jgi:hypothetical protein
MLGWSLNYIIERSESLRDSGTDNQDAVGINGEIP